MSKDEDKKPREEKSSLIPKQQSGSWCRIRRDVSCGASDTAQVVTVSRNQSSSWRDHVKPEVVRVLNTTAVENEKRVVAYMTDKCWNCEKTCTQRCAKCRVAMYCDSKCQLADWKLHKPYCSEPSTKSFYRECSTGEFKIDIGARFEKHIQDQVNVDLQRIEASATQGTVNA